MDTRLSWEQEYWIKRLVELNREAVWLEETIRRAERNPLHNKELLALDKEAYNTVLRDIVRAENEVGLS